MMFKSILSVLFLCAYLNALAVVPSFSHHSDQKKGDDFPKIENELGFKNLTHWNSNASHKIIETYFQLRFQDDCLIKCEQIFSQIEQFKYSQYSRQLKFYPIQFRECDIKFPFHFHW